MRKYTLRQLWNDFRDYEHHEMPWPFMVLIVMIGVTVVSLAVNQ